MSRSKSVNRVAAIEGVLFGILAAASFAGSKEFWAFPFWKVGVVLVGSFLVTFFATRGAARLNFENSAPYIERDWRKLDLWARNHLSYSFKAVAIGYVGCILISYWDRPFVISLIGPVVILATVWYLIPYIGDVARSTWREDTEDRLREGIADTVAGNRPPTQGKRFSTKQEPMGPVDEESDLERLRRQVRGE